MTTTHVEQIYNTQIKRLPHNEQLRLVAIITHALVQGEGEQIGQKRSILELEGLGAEIWQGIDAQEYVNKLRDEWDERP